MKGSIISGGRWIVVSTNRITGTEPLPFEGALQNLIKATTYLDEPTKGALISC